jgi:hypothetical protein
VVGHAGRAEGAARAAQGPKGARRNKAEKEDTAYDFKDRINFSVFPSLQGGPHNHQARAARSAAGARPGWPRLMRARQAGAQASQGGVAVSVSPDAEAAQHTGIQEGADRRGVPRLTACARWAKLGALAVHWREPGVSAPRD